MTSFSGRNNIPSDVESCLFCVLTCSNAEAINSRAVQPEINLILMLFKHKKTTFMGHSWQILLLIWTYYLNVSLESSFWTFQDSYIQVDRTWSCMSEITAWRPCKYGCRWRDFFESDFDTVYCTRWTTFMILLWCFCLLCMKKSKPYIIQTLMK